MKSLLFNGGMLGKTLDLGASDSYVVGVTPGLAQLTLVGSQTVSSGGSTSDSTVAFNLSGGISTTPSAGDIVILSFTYAAAVTTPTPIDALSGWTTIASLTANDSYDSLLWVAYKIMGSTPDTTFPLRSSGFSGNARACTVFVWRGVDATTPLDVTTTTATGANSRLANPPAITPVTSSSIVMSTGAAGHSSGAVTFTSSDLSGFVSVGTNGTNDCSIGTGYVEWTGGTVNPAAFSAGTSATTNSWTATTFALRAAIGDVPAYGNKKNSGLWNIASVFTLKLKEYIDPFLSSVSLLLHFDGANSGTTFVDSSPSNNTITAFGGAVTSTTALKYGSASGYFDGDGDYLRFVDSGALDFGTGDFTVEAWIHPTSLATDNNIIGGVGPTNGDFMFALRSATELSIGRNHILWDSTTSGFTFSTNTWYHVAVSRTAGVVKIFVNGVEYFSGANTLSYNIQNTYVAVGARQLTSGVESYGEFFSGYIDELRVTKGIGRYTAAFTPPSTPFQGA